MDWYVQGLSCFNPKKNTFINFLNQSNLLPGYVVNTILEAADGKIYAGTTEGIACFDVKAAKLTTIQLPTAYPAM